MKETKFPSKQQSYKDRNIDVSFSTLLSFYGIQATYFLDDPRRSKHLNIHIVVYFITIPKIESTIFDRNLCFKIRLIQQCQSNDILTPL